jgi:hypothetical protein
MIAKEYDHALHDGDYNKVVELVEAAFSQCDADDVPSRYEAVIQQCERAWALLIRNPTDPATSSVQKEKARMRLSEIIMGCKQSQQRSEYGELQRLFELRKEKGNEGEAIQKQLFDLAVEKHRLVLALKMAFMIWI